MIRSSMMNRDSWKIYLLLLLLTLVVFWPLSLNLLSLKNDALVQYLPFRYHLSESVQNGYFPFWSPYLYTGFPIHADMQGETWNPFVLMISLFTRYNMSVLQWEVLLYLYLAAVGMYRLARHFTFSQATSLCCASAYLCCGYMTDSVSVIPWVASAAFIPFVCLYFLRLLRTREISHAAKFSVALSLLFLCGYPSFFIFLNYILLSGLVGWMTQKRNRPFIGKTLKQLAIAYIIFILICSPAIVSYYTFLPYYSRGAGVGTERLATNPFLPYSLLTYFLPNLASKTSALTTDMSMRNASIGIFLFMFFCCSLFRMNAVKKALLYFVCFAFLFSLGNLTPLQKFCYDFIPLMNTFRHPGTIRVFTSIGMILIAGYGLNDFFSGTLQRPLRTMAYLLILSFMGALAFFLYMDGKTTSASFSFSAAALRQWLYSVSLYRFAAWMAGIQLMFVLAFLLLLRNKASRPKIFVPLIVANLVLFAWLGLPFTVVSQYRTKDVNSFLASFPQNYPPVDLHEAVTTGNVRLMIHGYPNFYNKKITLQDVIITPTVNTDYGTFLHDTALRASLERRPFAYLLPDSQDHQDLHLRTFHPNAFAFEADASVPSSFYIFQQYNHNWKVKVNGKATPVKKANDAFMSVDLPAGHSVVEWQYSPAAVYGAMVLSGVTIACLLIYFLWRIRKRRPHA